MPDVLNWETAVSRLEGDREALVDMIELFFDDYPDQMDTLERALEREDGSEIRRAAHTLKGSLQVFGAEQAAEAAKQLEDLGDDEQFDEIPDAVDELRDALERVVPKLADRAEIETD